ncbi:MAG: double zinc ribbon domain-containing protein [Spirochaetia bacterium]|jgi:ComF family protein
MEALFPGRCLQCGDWLLLAGDDGSLFCDVCTERLAPLKDPRCRKCGIELISETGTCLRCRNADYSFDWNMSLFPYTGGAKRLLAGLKFGRRKRVADFFAPRVADTLRGSGLDSTVVVPAPPRRGQRAPDAVELVARELERTYGFIVHRLLQRAGIVQQKSLDYEQRRANLKGKISIVPRAPREAIPREVVLLDDVFTTGATLDACARVMREAGCASVKAVTLVLEE